MAGKFEVFQDKSGQYRFNLKAANGEVIASSEGYVAKASALKGIESVRKNAADAEIVERDA
ncbi:YegP family protein [Plantibacter sp. Mn2098]|uniref:YegP family protein n=1 Tax=Plantibacter sp. Mn2098 TaxID=3395266 RepID=UPI003BED8640